MGWYLGSSSPASSTSVSTSSGSSSSVILHLSSARLHLALQCRCALEVALPSAEKLAHAERRRTSLETVLSILYFCSWYQKREKPFTWPQLVSLNCYSSKSKYIPDQIVALTFWLIHMSFSLSHILHSPHTSFFVYIFCRQSFFLLISRVLFPL